MDRCNRRIGAGFRTWGMGGTYDIAAFTVALAASRGRWDFPYICFSGGLARIFLIFAVLIMAQQDAQYFVANCDRIFSKPEFDTIHQCILGAYRWQYIVSGVQVPHFGEVLTGLINEQQSERIFTALAPIM